MSDLELLYKDLVNKENFDYDQSQYNAVKILNGLRKQVLDSSSKKRLFDIFEDFIFRNNRKKKFFLHQGIYLYGGVGTGKTMVMNLFFQGLHLTQKRRVHFHEFMHDFHQKTKKIRNIKKKDPVKIICEDISKEVKVLCFDEFQIMDITDAMIVGRLFEELIKKNVIIITTSNFKPQELYNEGLNRKLFLPFINFIENKFEILEVDNKVDYRKKKLKIQNRFFLKKNKGDFAEFNYLWERVYDKQDGDFVIKYQSRELRLKNFSNGISRISFSELCETPLNTIDYLNLCNYVKVLFLENIPQINKSQNDLARRFINLIDILYESRVQLICFSSVIIEDIYIGKKLEKEFRRTVSRLNEMQSGEWVN